jgi:3'-phosphoadenosine 5'-phosphosulfate sulfotransferase (PAPS reductase)/FAD synthetase
MKHLVSFSGGLGSWMCARRVAEQYGTDDLYLVFTDVLIEDEDLYRFLPEAAADVGGKLIWLKGDRDPWDVFREKRYMGNTLIAHCSEELKTKPFYKWVSEQGWGSDDFTVYLGIDWTESHRLENAKKRRPEVHFEAPLCEKPLLTKEHILTELKSAGIELPKLYKMGFSHNNCGGCCVKAGQGQWARVLEEMPERYADFEKRQEDLMRDIPTTRPFLRMTIDKKKNYLSLKDFRKHIENGKTVDTLSIGGCGCFLD